MKLHGLRPEYVIALCASMLFALWALEVIEEIQSEKAPLPVSIHTHRVESEIATPTFKLPHTQDTWIRALEWCESRGVEEAVNPMDSDGTPSYGSWQFKPDTFWYFAQKYELMVPENQNAHLAREHQLEVLKAMIKHRSEINWYQQFPACVRKIGLPPAS